MRVPAHIGERPGHVLDVAAHLSHHAQQAAKDFPGRSRSRWLDHSARVPNGPRGGNRRTWSGRSRAARSEQVMDLPENRAGVATCGLAPVVGGEQPAASASRGGQQQAQAWEVAVGTLAAALFGRRVLAPTMW